MNEPVLPEGLRFLGAALDSYGRVCAESGRQEIRDQYQPLEIAVRQLLGKEASALPLSSLPEELSKAAETRRQAARPAPSTGTRACPPLPKIRKLFGVATTVDGDAAVYTEKDTSAYGHSCFQAGVAHGRQMKPITIEDSGAWIQKEEDVWARYRNGQGPKPA